jgi:hypothetical protein
MDKLEEHIRKNREDLDRYDPSHEIWNRIERNVRQPKSHLRAWRAVAATALILAGISSAFYLLVNRKFTGNEEKIEEAFLLKANPQLKETQIYYNNLLNSLYKEATPLLTVEPEIETDLKNNFSQIDSICADIKKDLKDNVANQEVIEALIQNYRLKIRLLEEILTLLKQNENDNGKNKSHEL